MNKILKEKIAESLTSVLPITIIVFLLSIFISPMDLGTLVMFFVGAVLLIVGMGFFQLGADIAMMPLGEGIGVELVERRRLWMVIVVGFLTGLMITLAEPDLWVMAEQVSGVPNMILILAVSVGVGIFLVVAICRILFRVPLSYLLIGFYVLIFILSLFVPKEFVSVAFDSGGVTTGPITVPFIMAIGLGLASVRSDKESGADTFGLVALCSVGPILSVLILGIIYNPTDAAYVAQEVHTVTHMRGVLEAFAVELPSYFLEVLVAVVPIASVLVILQLFTRRYSRQQLLKMGVGFLYTLIGLVMFLTGVNVGFVPVGSLIGSSIAGSSYAWLLVPLGMVIGYFTVAAEPAVQVLNRQVEEVSGGAITANAMQRSLSIGVSLSLGLSMIRVLTGISIYWFLVPGYAIALLLTFFVPKIYTSIAFDSGGVASGPMTSTFLLPLAIGSCLGAGGNVMVDAFGVVAMVAMTPLIVIQLMGLAAGRKERYGDEGETLALPEGEDIIEYEEVTDNA